MSTMADYAQAARKGCGSMSSTQQLLFHLKNSLASIQITDILDILLVSVILFYVYRFIRERRAGKLAAGIVFLLLIQLLATAFEMHLMRFLLEQLFAVGIIALIILFQPELRSALEKVGGEPLKGIRVFGGEQKNLTAIQQTISEVCQACRDMAQSKTGALIVFERSTRLGDIIRTGTVINADVNAFLLKNIFFNKAPMHDGAVIISHNRIFSAGCFLPLSLNQDIIRDLGTRHRAGIGMSENSDAVVVIVSEETGQISTSLSGKLVTGYDETTLRAFLENELINDTLYQKIRRRRGEKKEEDTQAQTFEHADASMQDTSASQTELPPEQKDAQRAPDAQRDVQPHP